MKINMKKTVRFAGAVCVAAGVVAASSLAAGGAAVLAVKEGFKTARETFKKAANGQKEAELFDDEALKPETVTEPAPAEEKSETQGLN